MQQRRGTGSRWLRWLIFLSVVGALVGGAAVVGIFVYYGNDPELPHIDRASDYKPKVVTKVMSSDGELVGEIFEERRTVVPREKISDHMIHAIVDAEDADYYKHSGLSYWGMARAMWHNLKPGAHKQGASTLTQQLVRNLILQTRERTLKRKVQEIILAYRLDKALSKDDVLTLYLNSIDFGHNRYGVEEAARFYFGKSISDVDPSEAALLASLPKAPYDIDPWKKPDRAKERQRYVLSQMVRYGHLDAKEAEKFAKAPIAVVRTPAPFLGVAPEVTDEVKKQLLEKHGKKLFTMGLTVVTTIDAKIQKLAREALEKGLVDLDGRQGFRKPIAKLSTPAKIAAHEAKLKKEFPEGPGYGSVADGVIKELVKTPKGDGDGAKVGLGALDGWLPMPLDRNDRYNPQKLPAEKRFAVGDVVRVRKIDAPEGKPPIVALELGPQSAAVVIDPKTREVKAVVGGYGFRPGSLNRAIASKPCRPGDMVAGCRQPGSTFKPFAYAAALATGKFTPATVLNDAPQILERPGLEPWKPSNADASQFAGAMRLRTGLAHSKNSIAAQLVDTTRDGVEPQVVANLARECGIESELTASEAIALGASEVSMLELVNAYATFAAGGKKMDPVLVKKIGNQDVSDEDPPSVQALKPEVAFLITSMLTSVIEEGTAVSARGRLGRPTAGKTGTVVYRDKNGKQVHTDAWFVGFTPDLVAGVWVGFDDKHELGRGEQGGRAALPIWIEIMLGALKGVPPKPFPQPPGIIVQKIDPKTGLLAPPGMTGIDEYFLDGTAPTEVAPQAGEANPDTYIIDQAQ